MELMPCEAVTLMEASSRRLAVARPIFVGTV